METRQLKLSRLSGDAPLMPEHPLQWTDAELAQWHDFLASTGRRMNRRHWENLQAHLADQRPVDVKYRGNQSSAEALASAPLNWLAERANSVDPSLPLLAHQVWTLLQSLKAVTGPAELDVKFKLTKLLQKRDQQGRHPLKHDIQLKAEIVGRKVKLSIADSVEVEAPVTTAALSIVRQVIVAWRRAVRCAIAMSVMHVVPPEYRRTLGSVVELGIPEDNTRGVRWSFTDDGAWFLCDVLSRGRGDRQARYQLAGKLLRAARGPFGQVRAKDVALDSVRRWIPAIASLVPALRSDEEILSSAAAAPTGTIRPLKNGQRSTTLEGADAYEIWVDGICGMERIGVVRSLRLAVDIERGMRREPGIRLSLSTKAA